MFTRKHSRPTDDAPSRGIGRALRWSGVALAGTAVVYVGYLVHAYSIFHGRTLDYPQDVLIDFAWQERSGQIEGRIDPEGAPVRLAAMNNGGGADAEDCRPSATAAMQARIIELMVVENTWVPARPLYKFGFFGVVDFEDTPWFDNKAAEQLGMLDILRRTGIEMRDSLGRIRGTSLENPKLAAAQSALQINENAWFVNNPFSEQQSTISPSAASSYESAIQLYRDYNRQLSTCESIFDTRADNLRAVLSRFTATLGATTSELEARSMARVYDPRTDEIVEGEGNNLGWFDFRADNQFHRARGKMLALHGILKAMRVDFRQVIQDRDVDAVWDQMEATVGAAVLMDPLIVSNGRSDGLIAPDHLAAMAEVILRARTSMVEIRDILAS